MVSKMDEKSLCDEHVFSNKLRVADFFCGGGGFSEGFRQAGFNIVFAVDKWAPAVRTYKGNKPYVNVIQDDVIRISNLPDDEFEALVPDSEVIIGSPPCQSFSHSNKSGNADKSVGIQLIEAYLKIIFRKKNKPGSVLRYWVLENVPGVKEYINEKYTAKDFGLVGDSVLFPHRSASGIYNAKYFGAPTNRERYLCGEFPKPMETKSDKDVTTLKEVLDSLGDPLRDDNNLITDINYPSFALCSKQVTDQHYIYELSEFEYKTSKRLKQDKGYMGKMSFPENLDKPARTVMATMTASSREAMILGYGEGRYRLPTVREAACMMSFPIDYWFYGASKGVKHTLVGNAVPPKLSYAVAKAIAQAENQSIPNEYIPIQHAQDDKQLSFINLNDTVFEIRKEKAKRIQSKFKYHIPYLIIDAYRVELTNYQSDFKNKAFWWKTEIHHSQGKINAKVFTPNITMRDIPERYKESVSLFIKATNKKLTNMDRFQAIYCLTSEERMKQKFYGPYELLDSIKSFIENILSPEDQRKYIQIKDRPNNVPLAIATGYLLLSRLLTQMRRK